MLTIILLLAGCSDISTEDDTTYESQTELGPLPPPSRCHRLVGASHEVCASYTSSPYVNPLTEVFQRASDNIRE